ncbi:hypothetical protein DEO72_LG5g2797 [Vigna unguiculata]|uniref:Uncharacterized protein n=1 Tax=Vigna unguiculata TaxID=3917 RepID=A0A4D6M0P7_VIGUN|nr:hypothetical protein DEO72_LG5g2797 [Vigna unguiculata]
MSSFVATNLAPVQIRYLPPLLAIPPLHKPLRAPPCCASPQVPYCVRALVWVVFRHRTLTHFRPSISLSHRYQQR